MSGHRHKDKDTEKTEKAEKQKRQNILSMDIRRLR